MDIIISGDDTSTLKMKAAGSSQMIVSIYQTTQHHTSENHNFNTNVIQSPMITQQTTYYTIPDEFTCREFLMAPVTNTTSAYPS